MLLKPIVLHVPVCTLTSDDAGLNITQYELPPLPSSISAPYHLEATENVQGTLSYVPSLAYFCVKALIEWPDQVHASGPKRPYEPASCDTDFDILQALIPSYRPFSPDNGEFNLRLVDPRLWAVIVQLYDHLPPIFRTYTLPLSDVHLPLLQRIPNTSHFSLITVLSLAKCTQLTDDTVVELRELHTLTAFDASSTALGSFGLLRLAKTLSWSEPEDDTGQAPERRGLWALRVLYLKNCSNVDDKLLDCLARFPLLSVVDLRGTRCAPWMRRDIPFRPSADTRLYNGSDMPDVLAHLSTLTVEPDTLFSHKDPHILFIDSLYHRASHSFRACTASAAQLLSGRLDVFLPPDTPSTSEPDTPLCDYASHSAIPLWMQEAAWHAQHMHASESKAERFYSAPVHAKRRTPKDAATKPQPSSTTHKSTAPDPRMLFRLPRPWSALPTQPTPPRLTTAKSGRMPASVFHTSLAARALQTPATAFADRKRKRMVTLSSLQNMLELAQKRPTAGKADSVRVERPSVPLGRANPFARGAQVNATKAPPAPKQPAESSIGSRSNIPSRSSAAEPPPPPKDNTEQGGKNPSKRPCRPPSRAVQPDAARPAKKMRPVSELPVPIWPIPKMKSLSEHRQRIQLASSVPKAQAQRREFVPHPVRQEVIQGKLERAKETSKWKDGGMAKEGRRAFVKSTTQGFDWKRWSAG